MERAHQKEERRTKYVDCTGSVDVNLNLPLKIKKIKTLNKNFKPIWTYSIQLCGWEKLSYLKLIKTLQNKVDRGIVRKTDVYRDLKIKYSKRHNERLNTHVNIEIHPVNDLTFVDFQELNHKWNIYKDIKVKGTYVVITLLNLIICMRWKSLVDLPDWYWLWDVVLMGERPTLSFLVNDVHLIIYTSQKNNYNPIFVFNNFFKYLQLYFLISFVINSNTRIS